MHTKLYDEVSLNMVLSSWICW